MNRSRTSSSRKGKLVVLSGPSGCGKTTVGKRLVGRKGIRRVVTATSRPPRKGEKDGIDYRFYTRGEFNRLVHGGEFLEWVQTLGNCYGTPRSSVDVIRESGDFALLIIDVKGARKIRDAGEGGIFVFLEPPSMEELERRLRGRGTEDEGTIEKRLRLARREMKEKDKYDFLATNGTVTGALRQILGYLRKRGWKG